MSRGSNGQIWIERAVATASAIDRRMFVRRRGLYGSRRWWFARRFEFLWPFACAWSAACTLGSISPDELRAAHLSSYLLGLGAYRPKELAGAQSGPLGFTSGVVRRRASGGDVYYDDNAWVALALLHQHSVTGEEQCLLLAERVLEFVTGGWSTDTSWVHPGGIRWKQPVASTTRNTCSNGPVIEAAVQLYELLGKESWLEWALRIYRWVNAVLKIDGSLYGDHIDPDGARNSTIWTYNQGSMIGAATLLARATGEESFLEEAVAVADGALERFDCAALLRQPVAFNAIFLRNLLLLDRFHPDPRIVSLATSYGETMWRQKGSDDRLFASGSSGSSLNAIAPLVEVYALVGGAPPRP